MPGLIAQVHTPVSSFVFTSVFIHGCIPQMRLIFNIDNFKHICIWNVGIVIQMPPFPGCRTVFTSCGVLSSQPFSYLVSDWSHTINFYQHPKNIFFVVWAKNIFLFSGTMCQLHIRFHTWCHNGFLLASYCFHSTRLERAQFPLWVLGFAVCFGKVVSVFVCSK